MLQLVNSNDVIYQSGKTGIDAHKPKTKKNKISKKELRKRQSISSKYQKELKSRATSAEIEMQKILKRAGIKFLFQKDFIYYIVDFYLPKPKKICIEIDGGYHLTEEQIRYDNKKDAWLESRGYRVVRFTNEQVFNNPMSILETIRRTKRIGYGDKDLKELAKSKYLFFI